MYFNFLHFFVCMHSDDLQKTFSTSYYFLGGRMYDVAPIQIFRR